MALIIPLTQKDFLLIQNLKFGLKTQLQNKVNMKL